MKCKPQPLQDNKDTLNQKWVKVLLAEQYIEDRLHSASKYYPRRCLLLEFDDELAADAPDRPPRWRDRTVRENFNTQPASSRHRKDPVDYLDPHDVRHRIEANRGRLDPFTDPEGANPRNATAMVPGWIGRAEIGTRPTQKFSSIFTVTLLGPKVPLTRSILQAW